MRALILAGLLAAACTGETETESETEAEGEVAAEAEAPPTPEMPDPPENLEAPPADAEKTESGLASVVIEKGESTAHPTEKSLVTVHYTGWKADGTVFDSSIKRNRPAQFGLNQVIKGWTEGVQLMTKGETRVFWIPADLAYGESPGGGRPGGLLVFQITLLDIMNPPANLKPPEGAPITEDGIAHKVLREGTGRSPTLEDRVHLHFVGWTETGDLIRSSYSNPEPLTFKVDGAIPGWKKAIQQMKIGEKGRFWIPAELARVPGGPEGMAIFDFELFDIDEPLPAPSDVAAPPADATRTDSGLAFKVLKKGDGTDKPTRENSVKVSFTAWTTDGKMLDTTTYRDQPALIPVGGLPMDGLREGVMGMVEGDKRRLWIPENLAFAGRPRAPEGMIVYDIELHDIAAGPPQAIPPRLQEQLRSKLKAKADAEGSSEGQ